MHLDPAMPAIVGAVFIILLIGIALRLLQQPHVVAYLIAGIVLGPFGLKLIDDQELISRIGSIGVVLLLFFVGMEASPRQLASKWRVAVIGTLIQIAASIGVVWLVGNWLDWPLTRTVLLGCVISLSSTAVLLNVLQERGELQKDIGQDVLAVLLMQDVAVIGMIILFSLWGSGAGGEHADMSMLLKQAIGAVLLCGAVIYIAVKPKIHLPLGPRLRMDHELQVFLALGLCFGMAMISGLFELSSALGAFVGGMIVGAARETNWVHHRLETFRVVLVALFFVSIGMLVDLSFLIENLGLILLLVLLVYLTNTFINAIIFRGLGETWAYSLYAGALLAQIGEFSFVLAATGQASGIISSFGYQLAVAVIAVSLLASPFWILGMNRLVDKLKQQQPPAPI